DSRVAIRQPATPPHAPRAPTPRAGPRGGQRPAPDLGAAVEQEHAEPANGRGFADPRRAGNADAYRLAGVGQQRLHQFARRRLVIAAPALDQGDRPRQGGAVAGAEFFGEFPDIGGGILRQGHGLVYNARAMQARGPRAVLQRADAAAGASPLSFRHTQTSTGQTSAPIAMAARIAAIGRSKNGNMLPSDLISEVTNACSTMVPITMPSTMAATG